jgi:monoamine oxidase
VDVSLQSTLDEYILKKNIPDGVEGKLGLDMALESDIELEHAAPLSAMSLWWWDNAQWYAGGDAFLGVPGGGFTRIVEGYAEPLMPFIELRSKVTQINTTGEITQVTYTDERTNETNVILAKKVLVTVPIGVLQSGAIQFSPPLPTEKLNSIGNLGNGVMEKCFLHWEEDIDIFWPKRREWLMKVAKTEAEQGNWTMFHNAYEVNGGKAILAGYVVGDAAKRVGTMTDDQVVKEALESLREMFGADKVPVPNNTLVTRWGTDEFSLGAYSFQKVGSDFYDDRNNIMKQVDDKVWFAGEATSVKYPSTTHGALLSGIEAAQNILSN